MQDVMNAQLQYKINAFLDRKALQFPELHLEDRASLSGMHDREERTWKFNRTQLPHGSQQLVLSH